jgi:hypothetical protein
LKASCVCPLTWSLASPSSFLVLVQLPRPPSSASFVSGNELSIIHFPNSTNARRNINKFAFRVRPIRARIRILRDKRCRNQVSVVILVHKNVISQAGVRDHFRKSFRCRLEFVPRGSGAPRRGHQRAPGSGIIHGDVRKPPRRDFRTSFRNYRRPLTSPWTHPMLGGASLAQVWRKCCASLRADAAPPTYAC